MKIAICFSGQPRTWKKCFPRLIEKIGNDSVDVFFHFWDYNTLPSIVTSLFGKQIQDELLADQEKLEIIQTMQPKNYLFESRKSVKYWNCSIPISDQLGPWCTEQYYSRYYVSLLKREYEIKHDFLYDLVIWSRADLWITDETLLIIQTPSPNTIYTPGISWDNTYGVFRIGDIFYYADSYTSDQLAEIFKFFSYVPASWVTCEKTPPPEVAFYLYLASIGIFNAPIYGNFKLMRTETFSELKGTLDGYETR